MSRAHNYWWEIYKMFHEPPGTPRELKCVNCKIATSVALGTVGLGGLYMAKRTAFKSIYVSFAYLGVSLVTFSGCAVMARMAQDHVRYNELLIAETEKEIKRQRKKNLLKMKQEREGQQQLPQAA